MFDLINDAAPQHLAYDVVKAAAEARLKCNAAFDALTEKLKAEGLKLAGNVKDTLVQNAYLVFRNEQA